MNIPNILTVSRIILTVIFLIVIYIPGLWAKVIAFLIFTVASLTDVFDGYLARKQGKITDFGKLLDPIADKVLVLSSFVAFVGMNLVDAWMVMVIIARESIVTGLRLISLNRGKVIEASAAGKHKTVSQMVAIVFILIYLVVRDTGMRYYFWSIELDYYFKVSIYALMLITVILTLISGISYFVRNRDVIEKIH